MWWTELRNPDNRALVCTETAPVLKMALTPDNDGLWTATAESSVKFWSVGRLYRRAAMGKSVGTAAAAAAGQGGHHQPLQESPDYVIRGGSSIKAFHVLNDKRHILTKDTESNVALYDVLKAQKVQDLGRVNYDEELKRRLDVSGNDLPQVFKRLKQYSYFRPMCTSPIGSQWT